MIKSLSNLAPLDKQCVTVDLKPSLQIILLIIIVCEEREGLLNDTSSEEGGCGADVTVQFPA